MQFALLMLVSILLATSPGAGSAMAADQSASAAQGDHVKEIVPGMLRGYLTKQQQLDSKQFVLPAPAADSGRQALDDAWAQRMLRLRDTPRWDLATSDANLMFPAVAATFACALDIQVSEQSTPALYMLLRRTLTDIGLATYSAKNAYNRERPFMISDTPICTPNEAEALRKDGSYPSGHTAIGWGWALILTQLAPDRAEEILARGRAFGESRNVCNVHWYSDVVAGRLVGAAAVAKLHANKEFRSAMQAARADIERARKSGQVTKQDCAREAAALAETR